MEWWTTTDEILIALGLRAEVLSMEVNVRKIGVGDLFYFYYYLVFIALYDRVIVMV